MSNGAIYGAVFPEVQCERDRHHLQDKGNAARYNKIDGNGIEFLQYHNLNNTRNEREKGRLHLFESAIILL